MAAAEIIILSDDEDEPAGPESSVYIVEEKKRRESDIVYTLEEDLVVTFSRPAQVLPHARYDCPIHPFTAAECALDAPLAVNQLICDQCFCYICDKVASSCPFWRMRGNCHCNSHKKSGYWSSLRMATQLGCLHDFSLALSDMDASLRHAEKMLQVFKQDLFVEFCSFLKLMESGPNAPNRQALVHDYTRVFDLVSSFLDEADGQDERAAAVLRLGAAGLFIPHVANARIKLSLRGTGSCISQSPMADVNKAKKLLLQRVISSLQRQLVTADFTPEFREKLQDFYRRLPLPVELKNLRNSLCVRPWDDILLVTVLKGQNVTGIRKQGKEKQMLIEDLSVILLRSELLQQQKRYRELCRYLRVVQSAEAVLGLPQLRDLIPFFMCLDGDLTSAVDSLLRPGNPPASRFTPQLFLNYLRIFKSATAPNVTISHPSHLWNSKEAWQPIQGLRAVPLKRDMLVRFVLRVHGCCPSVYASCLMSVLQSQCWTSFLAVANTPSDSGTALPAPSPKFLRKAWADVDCILLDHSIQIPRFFLEEYPDQALLLLVTGALRLRILGSPLIPALPVLGTFKDNLWALEWLQLCLPFDVENLGFFLHNLREEIHGIKGGGYFLQFLHSLFTL